MADETVISALERLNKLRESGVLNEEEFAAQKSAILNGAPATIHIPFYRRLWFIVLLTCLMITFPVAMILLLTGDVYRKKDGEIVPIKTGTRYVYGGLLTLWLVALVARGVLDPASSKDAWDKSGDSSSPANGQTADANAPDNCDSSDAADMVKGAIEDSATSKIIATKVLDFGHAHELFFDKPNRARYCSADAELNSGSSKLSYKLYFGPSGGELVSVKDGEDAFGAKEMAEELEKAAQEGAERKSPADAPDGAQQGTCDLPTLSKGMLYPDARAKLVAQGAFPNTQAERAEGSYCADADHLQICRQLPEIEDCSADGNCKMSFVSKSGKTIELTIVGDGPNDPTASVQSVQSDCQPGK